MKRSLVWVCVAALALGAMAASSRADEVELLNGTRLVGKLIEQTDTQVVFEVKLGQGSARTALPLSKVHAISAAGERRVINPSPAPSAPQRQPAATSAAPAPASAAASAADPAGSQVDSTALLDMIRRQGQTPPDWWDSVTPDYPPTLDLTWAGPVQPWNHNKNMGQFIWDIINPNPPRWREGIKLLHTGLNVNKDNPDGLVHTINALANMYQNLLQDWARAAYWWHTLSRFRPLFADEKVRLAECYWKLGSRQMAVQTVAGMDADYTGKAVLIKLWSDMGDLSRALSLARERARSGYPDSAYLAAGDACRRHGRYDEALSYYRQVMALPQDKRTDQFHKRANANMQAIRLFEGLDLNRIPDGTCADSSLGYNGPIRLEVTVKGGRIEAVKVLQHQEKQFYSAFTDTVDQIIQKQGVRDVDATTGATWTSEAVINATAKALSGAMK